MKVNSIRKYLLIFVVCLSVLVSIKAWADEPYMLSLPSFTDQDLDRLLAPIALYPDPLLAQILPASTYPAEIVNAYNWLNSGGSMSEIDRQNWDESVKAIARYPDILKMMAVNGNWTADLGDAFLSQPHDVTRSIQRLRWKARDVGNLQNTLQQTVNIDGDYIEVIPAQPQYIYVPLYDPSVIYVQRWRPGRPSFITFGLGLAIGSWLTMDFDWDRHHIIYHGWNRPGWVNHARPHVRVTNVYVNRSRPYINNTWRHDASHGSPARYRALQPGGGVGRHTHLPEIRGKVATPSRPLTGVSGPRKDPHSFSNRGRESRGIVSSRPTPFQDIKQQSTIPVPSIGKGTPQPRPARESVKPPGTPSVTFGGYRGAAEAKGQSQRGQVSRQSSEAAARPSAAPVTRGGAPAGKDDPRGKRHR